MPHVTGENTEAHRLSHLPKVNGRQEGLIRGRILAFVCDSRLSFLRISWFLLPFWTPVCGSLGTPSPSAPPSPALHLDQLQHRTPGQRSGESEVSLNRRLLFPSTKLDFEQGCDATSRFENEAALHATSPSQPWDKRSPSAELCTSEHHRPPGAACPPRSRGPAEILLPVAVRHTPRPCPQATPGHDFLQHPGQHPGQHAAHRLGGDL